MTQLAPTHRRLVGLAVLAVLALLGLSGACGSTRQPAGTVDGAAADGALRDGGPERAPDGASRDGGAGVAACGFAGKFDPADQVLFFQDPKAKTEAQIVRRGVGMGGGFTTIYQLMAFGLLRQGQLHCISDEKSLSYDYAHHNWMDFARASDGTTRYELNLSFQPEDPNDPAGSQWVWTYPLKAFDLAGKLLWGPELLEKVPPD